MSNKTYKIAETAYKNFQKIDGLINKGEINKAQKLARKSWRELWDIFIFRDKPQKVKKKENQMTAIGALKEKVESLSLGVESKIAITGDGNFIYVENGNVVSQIDVLRKLQELQTFIGSAKHLIKALPNDN
jgi:hypothetical protein